ncbi:PREDICTED: uncharacterized protein LOC108558420 [Nicrophorus vespilloides]|uniref:Uncharacterized protein LOC108558420 n=1 Tax=Nicrophorus vespilloides TaxID=110193 RepID=A0ABM1M8C5_NICVS|nr:PREDICTED: uncharacterized protein LOC108558420 [Nicrophorus vespilloides]
MLNEMNSVSESNRFMWYKSKALDNNKSMNVCSKYSLKGMSVNDIWTKSTFMNNRKTEMNVEMEKTTKMSWSCDNNESTDAVSMNEEVVKVEKEVDHLEEATSTADETVPSPAHHARRPMNAFLIFCKKHRPIVRNKFPNLENRGVTRILGEWWALLDIHDKNPYTNLAKEYKDAFFSANPNFKWYKLPAPPLRTLPTRPNNFKQEPTSPISSVNLHNARAEFTPGKLADESQLGMLSTLLNSNSTFTVKPQEKNVDTTLCNNNNEMENNNREYMTSPVKSGSDKNEPAKPLKKRTLEIIDNKSVQKNIFESPPIETDINVDDDSDARNDFKDTRKSDRKCKGNRYAEFMLNSRLLKTKREKSQEISSIDLNNTIKRLEERILPKADNGKQERTRTSSEQSEPDDYSKSIPSFDLNKRICELTSLSYDRYLERKKESKKRSKFVRNKGDLKHKVEAVKGKQLIGSKKRKNKNNITHLEKTSFECANQFNDELSGLATLATIAAYKEKIPGNVSNT